MKNKSIQTAELKNDRWVESPLINISLELALEANVNTACAPLCLYGRYGEQDMCLKDICKKDKSTHFPSNCLVKLLHGVILSVGFGNTTEYSWVKGQLVDPAVTLKRGGILALFCPLEKKGPSIGRNVTCLLPLPPITLHHLHLISIPLTHI